MRRSLKLGIVAFVVLAGLAWNARAGSKWTMPVYVYLGQGYRQAGGLVGAARNSANSLEAIGCQVYGYSTGAPIAACWAQAVNPPLSLSCTTSVPSLVAIAAELDDSSYLVFMENNAGACTYINVAKSSSQEPKLP